MTDLLFSNDTDDVSQEPNASNLVWRVLIVDDEEAIHQVTKLVISNIKIEGRNLEIVSAYSAEQAKEIIAQQAPFAMAFIDVVMETDDAGLQFVRWLRREHQDRSVRIILRTGQPGKAPEESVIRNYDINDYKDKTELTSNKLITTLYAAIRSYRDIATIERSRDAFEKLIVTTSSLLKIDKIKAFGSAALMNLLSLMNMQSSALYIVRHQQDFDCHEQELVLACTGKYTDETDDFNKANIDSNVKSLIKRCFETKIPYIDSDCFIGYYQSIGHGAESVLYIEFNGQHEDFNIHLVELYATNVALILENLTTQIEIERTQTEIMYIVGEAIEARSEETGNHVKRVAVMCEIMAKKLNMPEPFVHAIKLAAPLHDIGKVAIPDAILHKPGKLNPDEWEVMQSHAKIGGEMLQKSNVGISVMGSRLAYYHHENWDGTGYPKGLAGCSIPLEARIMAIVDVFDALGANRCYKLPWTNEEIYQFLEQQKGIKFDPQLTDIMLEYFDEFSAVRNQFPD